MGNVIARQREDNGNRITLYWRALGTKFTEPDRPILLERLPLRMSQLQATEKHPEREMDDRQVRVPSEGWGGVGLGSSLHLLGDFRSNVRQP